MAGGGSFPPQHSVCLLLLCTCFLSYLRKTLHFPEIAFVIKFCVLQLLRQSTVICPWEKNTHSLPVTLGGQFYKVDITCVDSKTQHKCGASDIRVGTCHFVKPAHQVKLRKDLVNVFRPTDISNGGLLELLTDNSC